MMSSDFKIKFGELILSDYFDLTSYPTGRNDKRVTNVTSQVANGVEILSSRYEEKMIEFKIFSNNRTVREIDEVISKAINQGLAKLVFSDFPNEYYLAKLDGDAALYRELEDKSVAGTLNFIVPDGLSHYDELKGPYTATQDADGRYSVTLVNEGNTNAPITMTATMNAENGYIGMYTDYGVTELGNKEEDDTEDYVSATALFNTTDILSKFTRYTGTNIENSSVSNSGTATNRTIGGKTFLHLSDVGANNGNWHGASYVYDFPPDGVGNIGSINAYTYFNEVFWAGLLGQVGQTQVHFATEDNEFICGFHLSKSDTKGNTGNYYMRYRDSETTIKTFKSGSFMTSHLNNENPFNLPRGDCDMRKRGAEITFYWFGGYPKVTAPYLANKKVAKIYINLYTLDNKPSMNYFDFRNVRLTNDNATYNRDIKNRFQVGSKVKMTGADSKVYVDGMPKLSEKVDGSNLFTIPPGETTIYFQCSDWCTTPPTYQIEFTEANL